MRVRVPVPGGTLKFKTYRDLRQRERDRSVPVLKIGSLYICYWSKAMEARQQSRAGH